MKHFFLYRFWLHYNTLQIFTGVPGGPEPAVVRAAISLDLLDSQLSSTVPPQIKHVNNN